MSWIDIVFLAVIGLSAFRGLRAGLIHSIVSLIGVVVSIYAASRYYGPVATWLTAHTAWAPNQSAIVVFAIAFFLILFGIKIAFWLFERFIAVIRLLPFMSTLDRIFGLIFGALSGALTLGILVYFLERFPLQGMIMTTLATSVIAPYLSILAHIVVPLLPDAIRILKSSVDYVEGRVSPNIP